MKGKNLIEQTPYNVKKNPKQEIDLYVIYCLQVSHDLPSDF